jgi:hypothetical protein
MKTLRLGWWTRAAIAIHHHQRSLACILSFAVLLALHRSYGIVEMPFDAGEYWHLASPDVFGKLPSFRGYAFPALLWPLRFLFELAGNSWLVFRLGMSLIYAVLLALLVPAVFQQAFGGTVSFARRLVPVLLLGALFPGVLVYSLSDLPALLLAMGALYLALRSQQQPSLRRFVATLFASGVLMGAAYNTRTIYMFAMAGLLVLVAFRGKRLGTEFPRWIGIAAVLAGVFAVSLPQLFVNQRTHGISSLAVQARVNNHNLIASQMVWGMTLQRYETTVSAEAPAPTVFYLDPDGIQLFNQVADDGDLFSLRYYLKVVAQHPVHFLSLNTRHAINGLDVRDGNVYTRKPSPLRTRTALFNFSVLALACWILWSLRAVPMGPQASGALPAPSSWRGSLAVLLLPVLAILPGAIETRFFLPLHLLAYCVIAFHFDATRLRESFRKQWRGMVVAVAAASGVFFAVSSSTMAELSYHWPDVYRYGLPPK